MKYLIHKNIRLFPSCLILLHSCFLFPGVSVWELSLHIQLINTFPLPSQVHVKDGEGVASSNRKDEGPNLVKGNGATQMQELVLDTVQIFSGSLSSRAAHRCYTSHHLIKKKIHFIWFQIKVFTTELCWPYFIDSHVWYIQPGKESGVAIWKHGSPD